MGQVFLARHEALSKQVAMKFLAGDILQNPDAEHRFEEEITSLGKLQHPNILSAVDAGRAGEVRYLVTEYVDGKNLARLVSEEGPLHPARARNFLRQAAAGLACAHAHGFIHRDIKPSNLIVDAHGTLRLLDFGLVRNQQDSDGLTNAGQLLGTIDFLSPEIDFNRQMN
jgi:serine/threonine-protein kinase